LSPQQAIDRWNGRDPSLPQTPPKAIDQLPVFFAFIFLRKSLYGIEKIMGGADKRFLHVCATHFHYRFVRARLPSWLLGKSLPWGDYIRIP
jgi:hypothetical protein